MATSKAQILDGTALLFNNGGSQDYAFAMESKATNTGAVSAQCDLGSGARSGWYAWHCQLQMQATPTQYKTVDFYAAGARQGDNTRVWGGVGVSSTPLLTVADADALRNLFRLGPVVIEGANTTAMVGGGVFMWPHRYITIVGYNNGTGATINATAGNFVFYLQPFDWQGQAT